jgi:hypothetical protein
MFRAKITAEHATFVVGKMSAIAEEEHCHRYDGMGCRGDASCFSFRIVDSELFPASRF